MLGGIFLPGAELVEIVVTRDFGVTVRLFTGGVAVIALECQRRVDQPDRQDLLAAGRREAGCETRAGQPRDEFTA